MKLQDITQIQINSNTYWPRDEKGESWLRG